MYIYVHMCIYMYVIYHLPQKQWTPWLKALWLMSAALVGPALEVIREARWWFTSPSGSCPVAFFVLAAIVLCICSFTTGVLCGCCLSSRRCRVWLWHCISGLQELWVDSRGPAVTEVRRRLRDYRAWVTVHLWAGVFQPHFLTWLPGFILHLIF